jgi:hypothetical protein
MSWEQLQGILQENKSTKRIEPTIAPISCPIDGEILVIHPRGRRNCPLGNYTWTG